MSASKTLAVTVKILDKEYQVTCPEDQEEELVQSAVHLDQQMRATRKNSKLVGLERVAVMAAPQHQPRAAALQAGSRRRRGGGEHSPGRH